MFKCLSQKPNNGSTIAEILVAISIVAVIGTILVSIFTSTLQGNNKSQILSNIKQNGQAILENLDKTIRGADNVLCPRDVYSVNTLVIEKGGSYTRVRYVRPTTAANGKFIQDNPVPSPGYEDVFPSQVCTSSMSTAVNLTDTNSQTGVSVNSVSGDDVIFTRNQLTGSKDNVVVQFTLSPGVNASEAVRGQINPVKFQTTVQLR